MSERILTLTTDFGAEGPYVASMKGVVLGLAPRTTIVDVTHAIEPQNVSEAAFVLASVTPFFPRGSVHLAVVDPGVGTSRELIAAEVDGSWYVLPDNGLIAGVLRGRDPSGIWAIRNPAIRLSVVSATFHGRDILAPAASHLLLGRDPAELGPPLDRIVLPSSLEPAEDAAGLVGEVVFIDAFGNLITNIHRDRLGETPLPSWSVEVNDVTIPYLIRTYGDCPPGALVALIGSSDRLEVAVVNGNAARRLDAQRGTPIVLRRLREPMS
jgi:S-adenosylmethionine hydrolase